MGMNGCVHLVAEPDWWTRELLSLGARGGGFSLHVRLSTFITRAGSRPDELPCPRQFQRSPLKSLRTGVALDLIFQTRIACRIRRVLIFTIS
jgi:hypothetical protein